jgi:antiviral helicase SLH1
MQYAKSVVGNAHFQVLVCTSTLAWGVNLPAHAVVIKGTQVYDSSKGAFQDLSVLDVLQIFGRAGRPGYETSGVGYICTSHDKLDHYLYSIMSQHPIESKFIAGTVDSLNAEIALGTIGNVQEAIQWLGYTYLFGESLGPHPPRTSSYRRRDGQLTQFSPYAQRTPRLWHVARRAPR